MPTKPKPFASDARCSWALDVYDVNAMDEYIEELLVLIPAAPPVAKAAQPEETTK